MQTAAESAATDTGSTAAELDAWAMENVTAYRSLTPNERRAVRATVRQARALGIAETDIRMCASVAARSGVRIAFRKDARMEGYYDSGENLIVLNPAGKKSPSRLLLHELSHALYTTKKGKRILDRYRKKMDAARAGEIDHRYTEAGLAAHVGEEIAVHYAEDVLGNRATMERLLREEPTLGDKVLSFVAKSNPNRARPKGEKTAPFPHCSLEKCAFVCTPIAKKSLVFSRLWVL